MMISERNIALSLVAQRITDARTLAVVSCVNRTARRAAMQPLSMTLQVSPRHVQSQMLWLMRRLACMRHLAIVGNLQDWWYAWRVSGYVFAPKLQWVSLVHHHPSALVVPCLDEFVPCAPMLQRVNLVAQRELQVGPGLSRHRISGLTLHAPLISLDPYSLVLPYLQSLNVSGFLQTPFVVPVLQKLLHLHSVSVTTSLLPAFHGLSFPQVRSLSLVFDGVCHMAHVDMPCLENLALVNGEWFSDWIPESVQNLSLERATLHDTIGRFEVKVDNGQRFLLVSA